MKYHLSNSEAIDLIKRDFNCNYAAAIALLEFFNYLEETCGGEMVYDGVALRCSYAVYPNAREALKDLYGIECDDDEDAIVKFPSPVYIAENNYVVVTLE